jgi:heptosyltransferase-2
MSDPAVRPPLPAASISDPPAHATPPAALPLLVRLPNWGGDLCMALPALSALEARGVALRPAGQRWAADLLAGHGWPVLRLPAGIRAAAGALRPVGARRGLLLTNSLSSAAAFRLAGVAALGHRQDGRSLLLGRGIARPGAGLHEVEVFWRLARETAEWLALPALPGSPPARLGLRLAPAHVAAADDALRGAGIGAAPGFVLIAPLAAGTIGGKSKVWPGFAELARGMAADGIRMVCCPGPGEESAAREAAPDAAHLTGLGLGVYAALCARARLTIANDSGPMHLAAAVDAPVLGVFGPGEPARSGPWGPSARAIGGRGRWPDVKTVAACIGDMLS